MLNSYNADAVPTIRSASARKLPSEPSLIEGNEERATLVRQSIGVFFGATALSVILIVLIGPPHVFIPVLGSLPAFGVLGISYMLVNRGHHRASALLLIFGITAVQGLATLFFPPQTPGALVSILNLVLFAGFTLSPLASVFVAVGAVGAILAHQPLSQVLANELWFHQLQRQLVQDFAAPSIGTVILTTTVLTTAAFVSITTNHVARSRSRLEEAQKRLAEAQKLEAVGRLGAGLAHDFNNLLTTISGSAEVGRSESPENPAVVAEFNRIILASRQGEQLVRKLMGSVQPNTAAPVLFDLTAHLNALAPDLKIFFANQVDIRTLLPTPPCWLSSQRLEIEQILFNLISNAVSAQALQVQIRLEREVPSPTDPSIRGLELSVIDDGCGIEANTLEDIFDPFFTTRSETGGFGLGLAVSRGIVENMGGEIRVSSTAGQGTTFGIWLPEAAPPAIDAGSLHASSKDSTQSSPRVLLVDDDDEVRHVVEALLRHRGFDVRSAPGALRALAVMEEGQQIDVIVSDIEMPEIDGLEFLRILREGGRRTPMLLVSGNAQSAVSDEQLAPVTILPKPLTGNDLEQAIGQLLGGSG